MCPTLRSCSISPATADETQTTAATPNTAATPPVPDTPIATINSAATTSVHSVNPDTGLFDEPIMPHQVAGNGGEEESENEHDHRRDDAPG